MLVIRTNSYSTHTPDEKWTSRKVNEKEGEDARGINEAVQKDQKKLFEKLPNILFPQSVRRYLNNCSRQQHH